MLDPKVHKLYVTQKLPNCGDVFFLSNPSQIYYFQNLRIINIFQLSYSLLYAIIILLNNLIVCLFKKKQLQAFLKNFGDILYITYLEMKFPLFLPIIFLPTAVTQNDIIVSKRQIQQKTNPVQTTISQASINGSIIPLFTNQINSLVSTEENSLRMPTMPTMPKINNINPLVQKTNPISSTQNIFVKFSKINIKKLAEEGKIVAIQKIILIIVNLPSVKCETKVQYLLNIEGSIKAAINRKQLLFQEMKGLNEATVQVWRLQQLIKNLNKSKQGLNISHHQSNMINLLSQQTFLKNKIYQLKTQLESEQARVTKYMIEIEILSIQNTQKQNIINNRSLLLIQTNNQIQQIERKLKLAKQLQSDLVQGIIKSKDLVLKNNIQIQNLRQLIGATQFRIITLQNILDNLTKDAKVLEVDVFRSRLDLSNARLDSKIFQQQIKNFKAKISFQQIYLVDGDLQEICDQLTSLNQSLSYIQSQIDRQYYYCYGAGQINMISKGKATLYIMQVRDFRKYIYNAYQQNIDIPQLRTNQNQYQLQTIEHQTGIIHENRFLCSQGNLFETGMGIIIFKDVQYLVVLDSIQKKIKLSIRYCSRIEAATQAPQIGQKIAWKGQKFNAESYDLISATSWW